MSITPAGAARGPAGPEGPTGPRGPRGIPGQQGLPGIGSVTPEQIAAHIEGPGIVSETLDAGYAGISDTNGQPLTGKRLRFIVDADNWITDLIVEDTE